MFTLAPLNQESATTTNECGLSLVPLESDPRALPMTKDEIISECNKLLAGLRLSNPDFDIAVNVASKPSENIVVQWTQKTRSLFNL